MKIRVLIAEDHHEFRRALRALLESDPGIDVVGETSSGRGACTMAIERHADVVCMDWRMSDMDGVEAIRQLAATAPALKIIGLSAGFECDTESRMLAAGAAVYIDKANTFDDLIPAIHGLFSVIRAE
jgi:DNA-binding NarL/FixJ family response regulator